VCGRPGEPEVLDTLGALVDASLVVVEGAGPVPRFSMLETVRLDAGERLAAGPDRVETERRHTAWVRDLAGTLLRARGPVYGRMLARMERERANHRVAVLRALGADDLRTAAVLIRDVIGYLAFRDAEVEGAAWLDQALLRAADAPPDVLGRLLILRATVAIPLGDLPAVVPLLRRGRPLLPDDPDFDVDRALAAVAAIQEGFEQGPAGAARCVDDALRRFTELGIEIGQATMHLAAGDLQLTGGNPVAAQQHYRAAVDLASAVGEEGVVGRALSLLGLSQLRMGDVSGARRSIIEGARANRRAGQQTSTAYSLEALAALALAEGRADVAARTLAAAAAARGQTARPLTPALPPLVGDLVVHGRALLGGAFDDLWAEGRRWPVAHALVRALQDMAEPPEADRTG
jgi:hypothetical protein